MSLERDYTMLRQYANENQLRFIDAIESEGGFRPAARALGLNAETVRRSILNLDARAARSGYAPQHDMVRTVPDGYVVKGVSTLYDATGNVTSQWVKSRVDPERQAELFRIAAEAFAAELPRAMPITAPVQTTSKLMTVYPLSDHHFGMFCWGHETETDYDVKVADRMLRCSVDYLVHASPPSEKAAILVLGDFLDVDGYDPLTPTSGNLLDYDTRFPNIVDFSIRGLRYAIQTALTKHQRVHVIIASGNHDRDSSVWLRASMAALYENEPRIVVDRSPRKYHYTTFGNNLIGVHHGHGIKKLEDLPILMATDMPTEWGATEYRYWYTGHRHKDIVIDHIPGCRVEGFRVMCPTNAWAYEKGFRSKRDLKAIVLHEKYGEVSRALVNPAMLADAAL